MPQSNTTQFKQILVDSDNYYALKELGQTGDSFNDVIRVLIGQKVKETEVILSDSCNKVVFNPNNKTFQLRINSTLLKLGVFYVTRYYNRLEIDIRDTEGLVVYYPVDLDGLSDTIESELRLRTALFKSNI